MPEPGLAPGPWHQDLPAGISLRAWSVPGPEGLPQDAPPCFESRGRWLHPLFELRAWLAAQSLPGGSRLVLHDRVAGRAAAWLHIGLGIGGLVTGLASHAALELLDQAGIPYQAERVVERIDCRTEALLADCADAPSALALLEERRRAAAAAG